MRIFILSGQLTGGGAERVAVDLANGLADRGHNVIMYANKKDGITYYPSEKVELLPYNRNKLHLRRSINIILQIRYIYRQIRNKRPDVIIGIIGYFAFIAKIAVWLSGIHVPVIYSDHNALERPANSPMRRDEYFFKFYFSKYCDAYTVLTQADKDFVKGRLHNVHVMPNPLGITPCKKIPQKSKTVLAVGRLGAWYCKGFDILIDAWSRIAKLYPDWTLTLVGGGTHKDTQLIQQKIYDAQVEQCLRLKPYTKEIINYYQDASIFVLSSRYEGFGLVLTEAMSQGCACIACDYKGRQKEIIKNGIDGVICEPGNPEMLANQIKDLIQNENKRNSIQQEAIKSVERFSPTLYVQRWERLLFDIVNI